MTTRRRAVTWSQILAALSLEACSSSAPPPAAATAGEPPVEIVGFWYGNASLVDDADIAGDSLTSYRKDGSFSTAFRLCRPRGMTHGEEKGTWTVSGNMKTTTTLFIDGIAVPHSDYFTERYRLQPIGPNEVEAISLKSGTIFHSRRVAQDFRPPPDLCKPVP